MNTPTTPKPFAKLFEDAQLGQILVQRGRDDDGDKPGVRITFAPCVDELDPCDVFLGVGGVSEDTADAVADNLFSNMTQEIAVKIVAQKLPGIQAMFAHDAS